MKTKNVQRTDQINLFVDESFLFCLEMGKGFIKRNLNLLNISDYSFENVISTIEGLSKAEMIQKGLDRVLFVNGSIFESKLITEVVKEELSLIPMGVHTSVVDSIIEEKKAVSRYFSVSTLDSIKTMLNNANFIADGKISITENIAVGSTVSNDMILINMSNYNYELQNYTDIFEFTNGILKTKGNIDYETRLNYVLQIKISDKLDASKFWMDTIDVDVINVGDTLTLNTIRTTHIAENSSNGSVLGDLNTLFTKEVGMNTSLSLNNYTDKFSIANGNLVVNGTLDYETKASYTVSVKITNTDNVSQFWDMDVNVTIDNVGDTITLSTSRAMNIDQKVATGTVIGDLTTLFTKEVGLDVSMTVTTYTDKFSISGNNLIVNGVLDYAVTPQYIVTVRLTNTANTLMVWDMDVTVGINNTITGPVTITYKTDIFGDGSGIALYKFDGNANDEGGNYHGTETAITYGGGVYGRAAVFNGTSSRIDFSTQMNPSDPWSISFNAISTLNDTTTRMLMGFGFTSSGYIDFGIFQDNGSLRLVSRGAASNWVASYASNNNMVVGLGYVGMPILTSMYSHYVISFNGTVYTVYVNGLFYATYTPPTYTSTTKTMTIGAGQTGGMYYSKTSQDQVRIFNRAITAQEVKTLFNEPKPTSTVTFPARVIEKLPVAHYKFEGNVNDTMGNYNGTATNVTYAPGKFGTAAVFNGSSSSISLPLNYNMFSDDFTISLWAKGTGTQNYIFGGFPTSSNAQCIEIMINGIVIQGRIVVAGNSYPITAPIGNIGTEFRHIVMRVVSNIFYFYIDGVLINSISIPAHSLSTLVNYTIGKIIYNGSNLGFWNGQIDQVRIFNSALTQEEVTALFNEQPPADTIDDAIAYYKLDGNAEDALGNYNGVATNVTYLDGKFGKAGVFNGTSSNVKTTTINSNGFSISLWFKPTVLGRIIISARHDNPWTFAISVTSGGGITNYAGITGNQPSMRGSLAPEGTVTIGDWNFLSVSYNYGTGEIKSNCNGVVTVLNGSIGIPLNREIYIGAFFNGGAVNIFQDWFGGQIDQVRLFNRVLNQTEVGMLFNEASPIETVSYTKPVIQNDAIAHYKLDGDTKDAMGTYNGTATAVTYVDGKFGKAAVFNGTSSKVLIDTSSLTSKQISFSLWAKTSSWVTNQSIISIKNSGNHWVDLLVINNGLGIGLEVGAQSTTGANLQADTWYHFVGVYDSVGNITRVYINGNLYVSGTATYTGAITQTTIGCHSNPINSFSNLFNGSIDQVRIYNRALGQSEVTALFNEVLPTNTKNLLLDEAVAYYKMDGNANDSMGNYNGTATALTYADGKFGKAGVFNGSTSFFNTNYTLSTNSQATISFWHKNTNLSANQTLFADNTTVGTVTARCQLRLYASAFTVHVSNGVSEYEIPNIAPSSAALLIDGNFHLITMVYNGTSIKLYFDADLVADLTSTVPFGTAGSGTINFGRYGNYSTQYIYGSIDQVRIYDRAITASEVTTLFNEVAPTSIVDNTNPFNDGSCKAMYQFNGDATDKNGVYNGTLTGSPTYTTGKFGNAITVGGANYVTSSYNSFTSFSMSFWAKANSAVNAYYPIGLNSTSGFYGLVIAGWTPTANRIGIWDNAGNEYNFVTNSTIGDAFISATTFKHYTLTKSTDGYKMYINGILQPIIRTETFTINQVRIGQISNGMAAGIMQVDQFRIFNKALTSQEIQDLFIEGQYPRVTLPAIELDPFKDNSCKALYKFEGNALDSNGKYDGVATNVSYATGKFGQCAVFNGTSSVIDTGYQMDTVFSISAYAYLSSAQNVHYVFAAGTADTDDFVARFDVSTNALYFDTGAGSDYSSMALPTMANSWRHIVVAYGNGIRIAYVDGVKLTVTSVPSTATTAPYGTNLKIGNSYTGTGMKGMVDQVRIFNKVLTQSEVQSLFIEGQYAKAELPALELQPFADKSCKSYYKFDGNVLDSLGNSNGVATNVSYAQSKFGQCAVLGGNAYVTVNNFWNMPLNRTLSFWIKATQVNSCGVFSTTASANGYLQELTNSVDLSLYSISNAKLGAFPTVFDNTWHHLVVVETTTATYGYKNGTLVFTGAVDGVTAVTTMDIGRYTAGPYYMNGSIDQTRLFNKALTPMEVAALYTETTPTEFPMNHQVDPFKDGSGKALYKLDGNANDESGNYNGILVNAPTHNILGGRRCMTFNGINQCVNISTLPNLTVGYSKFSASIWVNPTNGGLEATNGTYSMALSLGGTNITIGYNNAGNNLVAGTLSVSQYYPSGDYGIKLATLNNNQWYHVVIVSDGVNITTYLDGVIVGTQIKRNTTATSVSSIGAYDAAGGYSMMGSIDQVRIFNRALTAQEVQALFTEI